MADPNRKPRREKYDFAGLQVDHSLFIPGKTLSGVKTTANDAAKRHGFAFSLKTIGMNGQRGVLVWRIR